MGFRKPIKEDYLSSLFFPHNQQMQLPLSQKMAKVVFSSYYLIIPDFFFKDNKIRQMVGLLGKGLQRNLKTVIVL